jgi:uncharacterized membrane protein YqjE
MSATNDGSKTRGAERVWRSPRSPLTQPELRPADLNGRSVAGLVRQLSTDTVDLMRQELELAKAEMREKMEVYQRGTMAIGIGAALLLGALFFGLWTVNFALTALLAQAMDLDVAIWLSPLILTIALGAVGWSMIKGAKARMKGEGIVPRQTSDTLKQDGRWAREKVHEIKEEIRHGR